MFAAFAVWFLKEQLTWNYLAAAICLVAAVVFIFLPVQK
ncbi:DMT family protein [Elioraea sp.]